MLLLIAGTCLVAFVLLLYMLSPLISPKPLALPGAHVVVTGGSSGIGKCIAIECYKQGAFITLVARNEERLLQAKKEIEKHSINDKQVVLCISVDVSQDYSQVENVIKQAQEKLGPVDMLINCAGMSVSGKFEDVEVSTFEKLMSINYLGSVYPSRAVITTMKERRVGRIVFLSSQAGQVGLFGYTAYSPSKFAIKGLAEALQMEVKPYNVYVTVAYPPDTDTPGFAEENKTKSPPCLLCRSFEKQRRCWTELLLSLLRISTLPSLWKLVLFQRPRLFAHQSKWPNRSLKMPYKGILTVPLAQMGTCSRP
uniref:3-ketodihydrosphingosine reductase n=1 Tax=Pipistrellus kuhlii TaxID=59472 RepID=A0A7J7Y960_PIPKU|nr:3-ketodihydrosphingosine reductase [Pipistrellus kuhlii]